MLFSGVSLFKACAGVCLSSAMFLPLWTGEYENPVEPIQKAHKAMIQNCGQHSNPAACKTKAVNGTNAALAAFQTARTAAGVARASGARATDDERALDRALLDAEFRTLLEIQDSLLMMLTMGDESAFGPRAIAWTEEQSEKWDQLSIDIVGLIGEYILEKTVRAEGPALMDPMLFGGEVGDIAERRAALWLELVESNELPERSRSIFSNPLSSSR